MSGNLGGFRSSGRSTAAGWVCLRRIMCSAGFAALLTFPGMGIFRVITPSNV